MDEEELKKYLKPKFQKNIYPDSIIHIRGSLQQSKEFVKGTKEEEKTENHWTEDDLIRRWRTYEDNNAIHKFAKSNQEGVNDYPMIQFFQENKTETFDV